MERNLVRYRILPPQPPPWVIFYFAIPLWFGGSEEQGAQMQGANQRLIETWHVVYLKTESKLWKQKLNYRQTWRRKQKSDETKQIENHKEKTATVRIWQWLKRSKEHKYCGELMSEWLQLWQVEIRWGWRWQPNRGTEDNHRYNVEQSKLETKRSAIQRQELQQRQTIRWLIYRKGKSRID